MDLLRGRVAFASGHGSDAASQLLTAARKLEPFDPELARETYLLAWGVGVIAGPVAGGHIFQEICRAARALPPLPGPAPPLGLLLDGLALLTTDGHAAAIPALQRAAKAVADLPVEDLLRWGWMAQSASMTVWDDEGWRALCARNVRLVRDACAC